MKRFITVLLLYCWLLLLFTGSISSEQQNRVHRRRKMAPMAVKKHSDNFNNQVDKLVNAYLDMKNAFVEADTIKAKSSAGKFIQYTRQHTIG